MQQINPIFKRSLKCFSAYYQSHATCSFVNHSIAYGICQVIGTRYQYQAVFSIPADITNWWKVNADLTVFHEHYAYNSADVAKVSTNGVEFNLNQDFKITPRLNAQFNESYQSPTYFVISQYKTLYYANAGLSYSILKNKGTIRVVANDIFNSYLNKYHTNYTNLDLTAQDKFGSRFFGVTFIYRFGSSSVKSIRPNSTEEQKRLGGSGNEN